MSLVTTDYNEATVHPWYLDTYRAVAEEQRTGKYRNFISQFVHFKSHMECPEIQPVTFL
jgi:hypothetical protein